MYGSTLLMLNLGKGCNFSEPHDKDLLSVCKQKHLIALDRLASFKTMIQHETTVKQPHQSAFPMLTTLTNRTRFVRVKTEHINLSPGLVKLYALYVWTYPLCMNISTSCGVLRIVPWPMLICSPDAANHDPWWRVLRSVDGKKPMISSFLVFMWSETK